MTPERAARLERMKSPANWAAEPMVDEAGKLHLPRDVVRAISSPLQMAFDHIGKAMDSVKPYEECSPAEVHARAAWHALHYVERRLSGWDKLPEDFFLDQISWETKSQRFMEDARSR